MWWAFTSLLFHINLASFLQIVRAWNYRYDDQGETCWAERYPQCKGSNQSPININVDMVDVDNNMKPIMFRNYHRPKQSFTARNNGHTVEIVPSGKTDAFIKGGDLNSTFRFVQLHFHWGGSDFCGSEHSLNGKFFPMEVHLVHLNNKYRSFREASDHCDGLAILATFLMPITDQHWSKSIEKKDLNIMGGNKSYSPLDNLTIRSIIDVLPLIKHKGQETTIKRGLILESLLPSRKEMYFRYHGSLSVPPCNEAVAWTIYPKVVYLGENQIDAFRELFENDDQDPYSRPLVNNHRPLQQTNNRIVRSSFSLHKVDFS